MGRSPSLDAEKPFAVNLWESHPDEGNDDCSTGSEFATEAEARACIANLLQGTDTVFNPVYYRNTPFIELDGPDVHEVIERPGVKKRARQEDRIDDNEFAMQQGMGLGINAFNEALGYDSEEYDSATHNHDEIHEGKR